ncbi:MAG: hypothetical protein A2W36_06850 [Chloroflexi bacterium RBG_16_58_14]|nr:MAG: hypothetical protein A2W36_06850 [Chloroflexi bacterium RBG_16_58_14]
MFASIRWRIVIPYVLLFVLVMLGLGAFLSNYIRQTETAELERELTAEAQLLAERLAASPGGAQAGGDLDLLARQWSEILKARVTLIAADGRILGESHEDRSQMDNHLDRPEIQQALAEGRGQSIRFSRTVGYDMMYVAVPVDAGAAQSDFVRLALPLQEVQAKTTYSRWLILAGTLVGAGLAILLATAISAYTARPLRELTAAARSFSRDWTATDPLPSSNDEVGQLGRAFESMRQQLRQQFNDLRAERGKLAVVLDQLTDGVMIVDPDGRIQLFNPAAQRQFSLPPDKTLGETLAKVIRQHQLVDLWRKCLESNESQVTALDLPARRQFLQVIAIPLSSALPDNVLIVVQDLTHLRHLETVRRDFISNLSHELRTPLAALKALAETLQDHALEDPPAARRFLAQVEVEVDSLSLMIQELLELSRIESGKVPLKLEAAAPGALLSRAAERLALQAERSGLRLEVTHPADLPAVLADPPRVEQVIVNLLHNAIKFTPPGGRISLSARQADGGVTFIVADSGVGIPQDDLPRIFERFYKADRARSAGGTGLGLAIARHLIEVHAGRIWAESVEGQGSTFYFTLPLA